MHQRHGTQHRQTLRAADLKAHRLRPAFALGKARVDVFRPFARAIDEALNLRAPQRAHQCQFIMAFHPFGGGVHAERGSKADHRIDDGRIAAALYRRPAHEALVDLDLVERRLAQIAEGRIAGAEIVERDAHAQPFQPREHLIGGFAFMDESVFGDLQLQPLGREPRRGERIHHDAGQRRIGELQRRDVDGDAHILRPLRGVMTGGAHHPFANRANQPRLLRNGDEHGGRDRSAHRMIPAQQCLEADDPFILRVDDRLEHQMKAVMGERMTQVLLQLAAVLRVGQHVLGIETMHSPAVVLRRIERQIGIAHQSLAGHAIVRTDRDAHRRADHDLRAFDPVWLRHRIDDRIGQLSQFGAVDPVGQHNLEFVPAEAADHAPPFHDADQALAHLAQQSVARRVAHGVVHILEAVEVDQEQRAIAGLAVGLEHALVEHPLHLHAIGEAGQRIELRQPRDLGLAALHFGEIVAAAAKAVKLAIFVDDRTARYRPPAFVAGQRDTNRHIGETAAVSKVEAERPPHFLIGAVAPHDQLGKLATDQLLRRHVQRPGERLGDIGERSSTVGFPEPAATGLLIFGQQLPGAAAASFHILRCEQALPVPARLRQRRYADGAEGQQHQRRQPGSALAEKTDAQPDAIGEAQQALMAENRHRQQRQRQLRRDHRNRSVEQHRIEPAEPDPR